MSLIKDDPFTPKKSRSKGSKAHAKEKVDSRVTGKVDQPVDRSVDQPVDQLVDQSIDQSTILNKPKAFYITEKQDEDLDKIVKQLEKKMKGKPISKIDRSMIVRLILESFNLSTSRSVSRLVDRLASQLTSRLISQLKE